MAETKRCRLSRFGPAVPSKEGSGSEGAAPKESKSKSKSEPESPPKPTPLGQSDMSITTGVKRYVDDILKSSRTDERKSAQFALYTYILDVVIYDASNLKQFLENFVEHFFLGDNRYHPVNLLNEQQRSDILHTMARSAIMPSITKQIREEVSLSRKRQYDRAKRRYDLDPRPKGRVLACRDMGEIRRRMLDPPEFDPKVAQIMNGYKNEIEADIGAYVRGLMKRYNCGSLFSTHRRPPRGGG